MITVSPDPLPRPSPRAPRHGPLLSSFEDPTALLTEVGSFATSVPQHLWQGHGDSKFHPLNTPSALATASATLGSLHPILPPSSSHCLVALEASLHVSILSHHPPRCCHHAGTVTATHLPRGSLALLSPSPHGGGPLAPSPGLHHPASITWMSSDVPCHLRVPSPPSLRPLSAALPPPQPLDPFPRLSHLRPPSPRPAEGAASRAARAEPGGAGPRPRRFL